MLIVGAGLSGIGAACHLQAKCPEQDLRDPRGARRDRRHVGPVPLPGHPLGLRHVHARLLLPAVGGSEGDRRRPVDPAATSARRRATTASIGKIRFHHRVVRAEWSTADARWTVEVERTDTGETVRLTCGFLFTCTGYYRYDEGYTPRLRGHRALRRADRAPAALARGPRLRRQARRRDRQRRDRGDARAGDGGARRARDDAPALAELRRLAAGARSASPTACAACCPRRSPTRSCAGRTCC